MTRDHKNTKAVMLGLAIGDALGWPVEFMRMDAIWTRYGRRGISNLLTQTTGIYTDDTQMTLAVADGLGKALSDAQADGLDPALSLADTDFVAQRIAPEFVRWSRSPENNRAPGTTCMAGCRALAIKPWREAGVKNATGCGAVMRVAPIGLVYDDSEHLRSIAEMSSALTHNSEMCRRSAHLGALAIKLAQSPQCETVDDLVSLLFLVADDLMSAETSRLCDLILSATSLVEQTLLGKLMPWEAQDTKHLGQSWASDEALASALYCVLLADRREEGFREAICYGANTPGDSDSIASIAGGIAGARWGIGGDRGIPEEWVSYVENSDRLKKTADRLVEVNLAINKR